MPRSPIVEWTFETDGEVYLVLRPTGPVAARFEALVSEARALVPEARLVGAHVTLTGWGGPDRPADRDDEAAIRDAVRSWARETPPLELRTRGLDVFEDERIPVLLVEATPDLREAQARIRERSAAAALPANASDAIGDWVFHASLGYLDDLSQADWSRLRSWWARVPHRPLACTVREAELVAYDGGPERLLETVPFEGPAPAGPMA